jgi:glyoxylase-like metal-dependent hydrolase (beta-lactamase superfamily II)
MFFHQIFDEAHDRSTYVLGCASEAVVVDPGFDTSRYLDVAAAEGARVRFVLETHAGDRAARDLLVGRCGAAPLVPAGPDVPGAPTIVAGDVLRVGDVRISPFVVPGTAPGRLAYAISDLATSDEPFAVLDGVSAIRRELIAA